MLGSDIYAHVTHCDDCSAKALLDAEQDKRKAAALEKWEAAVSEQNRSTDINHQDYQAQWHVHESAMRWLADKNERLMLGLIGDSGLCKTRIISQVVKRVIWEGGNVVWMNSSEFQWSTQNLFNDANAVKASKWLSKYETASMLVFDDIGSLKSTETVSDNLYKLLEYRTTNNLPMLWTSNETLGEMLAGKGITEKARKRNISRLAGYSNIIEL